MLNSKHGFVTAVTALLMVAILPLMMFAAVDVPFWLTSNQRIQDMVDNVAASAATAISQSDLAEGIIVFNEVRAQQVIHSFLETSFNLMPIPAIDKGSHRQLLLIPETASYFRENPIVIRLAPHSAPVLGNTNQSAPIIEYAIYNPGRTPVAAQFVLFGGTIIDVYHPTIIVSVRTRVFAPLTNIGVYMHKVGIKEVTLGHR